MQRFFEEIRQQIHEIRNMVSPFDARLANLDAQIVASRSLFEEKTAALETRVLASSFRIDAQAGRIEEILENYGLLSERVKRLETAMEVPPKPNRAASTIIPPESPVP